MDNTYKIPESVSQAGTFIADGVINKDLFGKNGNKKILFFLKEAYTKQPQFKLTDFLNKGKIPKMWRTAASWAYMMNHPEEARQLDRNKLDEMIRYCAVVNIKKINGKSKSEDKDLKKYFEVNKDNLKEQILEIDPDIIITGRTFVFLKELFKMEDKHTHVKGSGMGFYRMKDSAVIIARLRHPAYLKVQSDDYFEAVRMMYRDFVRG